MRPDGSQAENLTGQFAPSAVEPSISPDGSRIAFTSEFSNAHQSDDVYVMSIDGSTLINLTQNRSSGVRCRARFLARRVEDRVRICGVRAGHVPADLRGGSEGRHLEGEFGRIRPGRVHGRPARPCDRTRLLTERAEASRLRSPAPTRPGSSAPRTWTGTSTRWTWTGRISTLSRAPTTSANNPAFFPDGRIAYTRSIRCTPTNPRSTRCM